MKKSLKKAMSLICAAALTLSASFAATITSTAETDQNEWDYSEHQCYDLDYDGKFNLKDILKLRKIIAGYRYEFQLFPDFNVDGQINMKDYLIMRKAAAGQDYQLGFTQYDNSNKTLSKYIRYDRDFEYTITLNYNAQIDGKDGNHALADVTVEVKNKSGKEIKIKNTRSYVDPESGLEKDAPMMIGIVNKGKIGKEFNYPSPRSFAIAENGIDGIGEPDESGLYTGWQNRYYNGVVTQEYITLKSDETISYSDKFNANMTMIDDYLAKVFLLSVKVTYEVDGKAFDSTVYLPLISMSNSEIVVK